MSADEIRLDVLRDALSSSQQERTPAFARAAPEYVRFERPPVILPLYVEGFDARAKFYDFGVVIIELDQPFSLDWPGLVERAATVLSDSTVEQRAAQLLKEQMPGTKSALVNPYKTWLDEEYVVITMVPESPDRSAADLLRSHGREIAQMIRGENKALSESEYQEILGTCISYYPDDLLVVGWSAGTIRLSGRTSVTATFAAAAGPASQTRTGTSFGKANASRLPNPVRCRSVTTWTASGPPPVRAASHRAAAQVMAAAKSVPPVSTAGAVTSAIDDRPLAA